MNILKAILCEGVLFIFLVEVETNLRLTAPRNILLLSRPFAPICESSTTARQSGTLGRANLTPTDCRIFYCLRIPRGAHVGRCI